MTLDRLRHIVRLRLRSVLAGAAADRELDDELRFHIERQTDANIAAGMTPSAARTAALRAMGGVEQRKEEMRDTRGVSWLENLGRDGRLACRQLRKQPGFAATAIVSLALGIGANTAIFQLLNALSVRTLPVRAPHELVEIRLSGEGRAGRHTGRYRQISLPQYDELVSRQQAFSSLIAFGDTRFNLASAGEVRYVDGLWVSGNFFETLGVVPAVGRLITPPDDTPNCGRGVAVISYALWQGHYGGRADIIGQTVPFSGTDVPIVGVTAPSFFGIEVGRQFGVALPNCASRQTARNHWWLATIGRLKPGWTAAQAQSQVQGILPDVQQAALPDYRADWAAGYLKMTAQIVDASTGVSPLRRSYERPLWILMTVAGLVLLIASVNLANLLLARATARQQEFAVRLAIGGSRGRVLQQVLTESLVLAALGSLAAIGVAVVVSRSIPPLISTTVDRIHLDLSPDWRVFGFTAAVGILSALVFGLAPALRLASSPVVVRADRGAASNQGDRVRRVLVASQIAVTLVLLFGGLLFLRTFRNLSTQDVGVGARDVLVASMFFLEERYPVDGRASAFRDLDERLRSTPGLTRVAETYTTPLGGNMSDTDIEIDRKPAGNVFLNWIAAGYFDTLGTPVVEGRDFDARDVPGSNKVALVTRSLAASAFEGRAVGRRVTIADDRGGVGQDYEIVGVVADQKYADVRESHPRILFLPSSQATNPTSLRRRYVMQSALAPTQSISAITATLAGFDPTAAVRYSTIDSQVQDAMLQERLMARLSTIFGGVALVLALVGLYGVVSYTVASRRAEIGVRLALGASRSAIFTLIFSDIGRVLLAGVTAGVVLALLAGRAIASLLYGLEAHDAVTLAGAALLLTLMGLIAALWPARRAAAVDPVSALRES
jgi:predicted permease